jgi:hypothetical protein
MLRLTSTATSAGHAHRREELLRPAGRHRACPRRRSEVGISCGRSLLEPAHRSGFQPCHPRERPGRIRCETRSAAVVSGFHPLISCAGSPTSNPRGHAWMTAGSQLTKSPITSESARTRFTWVSAKGMPAHRVGRFWKLKREEADEVGPPNWIHTRQRSWEGLAVTHATHRPTSPMPRSCRC